jgi:hypothetical protein
MATYTFLSSFEIVVRKIRSLSSDSVFANFFLRILILFRYYCFLSGLFSSNLTLEAADSLFIVYRVSGLPRGLLTRLTQLSNK